MKLFDIAGKVAVVTGGGNGRHMVYKAGKTDHTTEGATMIDHIVELVEAKAAELRQTQEAEKLAAHEVEVTPRQPRGGGDRRGRCVHVRSVGRAARAGQLDFPARGLA